MDNRIRHEPIFSNAETSGNKIKYLPRRGSNFATGKYMTQVGPGTELGGIWVIIRLLFYMTTSLHPAMNNKMFHF